MLILFLSIFAVLAVLSVVFMPQTAMAVWTPLVASADFDGIKADLLTCVAALIAFLLIIVGAAFLVRALR